MKYLLLLFLTTSALASEKIEEIHVTADRITPLSVGNAMTSSMVVTQEDIQAKQYETVYQVLRDVPGVDVTSTSPGQTASVFIRGEQSEQTLVLIDGIEFNDPTDPGRGANLGTLRMDNVERIEIIRGAQTVLYPGVGGVINIITKSGASGQAVTSLSAEGGSFGTIRSDFSMRGKAREDLDYSMTLGAFRTDGISAAIGGGERDGSKSLTFSGRFGKKISQETRLELVTRYDDSKTDLDTPPVDILNFWATQRNFMARLQGITRVGLWEPVFGISYRKIDRDSLNYGVTPNQHFNSSGNLAKVDLANRFFITDSNLLTWGLESERQQAAMQSNYTGSLVSTDKNIFQGATFLQHEYIASEGFFSTIGARADYHGTFGWQPTFRAAPGYKLKSTGTVFRGAIGTGFKPPSIYQLYGEYGVSTLKPEKSFSVDAGFEQEIISKRSILIATAFYNRLTDLVDFDTTTSKYINVGRARTEGFELSQSTRLLDFLKWETAYTFLETKDEFTNLPLLRRPRNRITNTLVFSWDKLEAALTHSLVGEREDIDASTFKRKTTPSYQVVNLALDYHLFKDTLLSGRIENLFDAKYQVIDAYASPGIAFYAGIKQNL